MRTSTHTRLKACADSLAQMHAIQRFLQEQALRFGATQPAGSRMPSDHRQLFDPKDLAARRVWAISLKGDANKAVQSHLDRAEQLGPTRRVAKAPRPEFFDSLLRDFPHFEAVTRQLQQGCALCRLGASQNLRLQPMLLAGDPGVGKTAYAQAVAKLLGVPFAKQEVGTLSAAFSLSGLDMGYESGKPGLLWDLLQDECMSPVVLLDELDKLGNDTQDSHLGPLYGLLEPVSATRFADAAIGLPIDASWVSWLATCNDVGRIEPALRSRFRRFDIPMPSSRQMRPIVASIDQQLRLDHDWASAFDGPLPEAALERLCCLNPREARQALLNAYAAAAVEERRHLLARDVSAHRAPPRPTMGFLAN